MKLSLAFENYDEIVTLCKASVDAHPNNLALTIEGMRKEQPQPRHRKALCDDELTLDEMCYYEAGRLHVYYNLCKRGMYTMEQISEILDFDVKALSSMRHIWEDGEIVERGNAMYKMLIHNAERDMCK